MEEEKKKRQITISVCGIHLLLFWLLSELLGLPIMSYMKLYLIQRAFSVYPLYGFSQLSSVIPVLLLFLVLLTQLFPEKVKPVAKYIAGGLAALGALSLTSGFLSYFLETRMPMYSVCAELYRDSSYVFICSRIDDAFLAIAYLRIALDLFRKEKSELTNYAGLRILAFIFMGLVTFAIFLGGNRAVMSDIFPRFIVSFFLMHALSRLPVTLIKREEATTYGVKIVATVVVSVSVILGGFMLLKMLLPSGENSGGRTCAEPDCTNQAVSSGDSVFCSKHSNSCLNCGCYIDADAMYCMDCLSGAWK